MSWPLVKLGEVAPSKALKKPVVRDEDNVWQLNLDMVESGSGKILNKIKAPLSEAGSSTHWFDSRHVLYSKLRPYLNKVVLPDEQGLATTEFVPMLPDPEMLDRRYLVHYLRSKQFVSWISDQVAGAKMPRVSMKVFWEHEIPLPPLEEQKRIAAMLEKADAIRQKRKQAIDLADEFLRSVFLDMFGDPVTNPKGWEVGELNSCLDFLTSGSRGWAKYYSEEGSKFIRIQNVGKNKLLLDELAYVNAPDTKEAERTRVKVNDVLLSITADLGRSAVVTKELSEGHINQHLALLRLKMSKLEPQFLSALLSSDGALKQFKAKNKAAVKAGLNFEDIRTFEVYLPPLTIQAKYADIYNVVMENLDNLMIQSDSAELLFSSLSQKAFSGQL
ncbi:type I restriction enzyme, S subunit [Vibrio xiamenensis]|uniref:Type I restriction enzyme, S subunit n=1 Tax=Vibrio xiamenensis TaxID=861298 RepID=A0A1G8GG68_9VIBR|nr:restriction endonuclease subunit S [Vibrio xiamenensis]SDH93341.1 type I restriction enzyme, S subunit [Vibrio xiamenensis]